MGLHEVNKARIVGFGILSAGAVFAVLGGEYSTLDWWNLEQTIKAESLAIEQLELETDSLAIWTDLLESDSATQEKVAREAFGMVREGEFLYRVDRRRP